MLRSRSLAAVSLGLAAASFGFACTASASPAAQVSYGTAITPVSIQTTSTRPDTWVNYHRDAAHSGYDPLTPPATKLRRAWAVKFDGAVYGSPIQIRGLVIAGTENDSVYALDARNGKQKWKMRLGSPVPVSALPCGNVDPLGITGTPAYDPSTRRVFVVTVSRAAGKIVHTLFGLNAATGKVEVRRNVDPPNQESAVMNQRGALAVANGKVYVPYGGHAGDCGNYHGTVVGSASSGKGALLVYRVPTAREAGIWTPGGIAVDSHGNLYVAVGNGASGQDAGQRDAAYDQSDSVTKLSPSLKRISLFAPTTWRSENAADADLGSTGPLLVGKYVWIQGKAGTGYVLSQRNLGGIGGARSTVQACAKQFGGAAAHGMTVYAPCTDGLRKISISAAGKATAGWRAPSQVTGSPVVGGGVVWSLDVGAGVLYGIDEKTGAVRTTAGVGPVTRFATPMLDGSLIVVPTEGGLTAESGA